MGSGHGMAKVSRHTKPAEQGRCRQTQPADNPTGTIRQSTGLKETTATDVGRPLAVQCRLVEGVRWCWHSKGGLRPTLPVSLPPIAFACLRPYPLPQFIKPNLAPTYFFCFYFHFYFPTQNSSPNPLYCHCSANLSSPSLLPTPTFPSRRGIREG